MNETELRDGLAYVRSCLNDMHTRAEGRPLSAEEQRTWDEGTAYVEETQRTLKRYDEARRLASLGYTEPTTPDPLGEPEGIRAPARRNPWDLDSVTRSLHREAPERGGPELRDRALAAIEHVGGMSERSREHITGLLDGLDFEDGEHEGRGARQIAAHIVATSSPEYLRAWKKAWKTGMRTGQPDMEAMGVLQRAASLTDSAGGYAVPLPVDPTLILNDDGSVNPIRQLATVRTVVTDAYRTVNATAVTASYDAEASEVSDDTPTWANIDITVHMARAFIPHSIEIGMDYPGFTSDIAMLLSDAKANLEATKFITGSGSGEPVGIVTALDGTSSEIFENTDDTFSLGDVYDLDEELPARFSSTASWIANKKIYQQIREAGGANLDDFWVNLRDGRPPLLLGHPAYEASAMDGVITTSGAVDNFVMVLGDFRWYWITERAGFSMELIPHLFHTGNNRPSGQRGVFAYWRNGADSVLDRAFRLLNIRSAA